MIRLECSEELASLPQSPRRPRPTSEVISEVHRRPPPHRRHFSLRLAGRPPMQRVMSIHEQQPPPVSLLNRRCAPQPPEPLRLPPQPVHDPPPVPLMPLQSMEYFPAAASFVVKADQTAQRGFHCSSEDILLPSKCIKVRRPFGIFFFSIMFVFLLTCAVLYWNYHDNVVRRQTKKQSVILDHWGKGAPSRVETDLLQLAHNQEKEASLAEDWENQNRVAGPITEAKPKKRRNKSGRRPTKNDLVKGGGPDGFFKSDQPGFEAKETKTKKSRKRRRNDGSRQQNKNKEGQ